jgi:hypothetical protein
MFHLFTTPGHTSQSAIRPKSTMLLSGRTIPTRQPVLLAARLAKLAALLFS